MKRRLLLLALGLAAGGALAQQACPADGRELPARALYGHWEARIEGVPGIARVQLARHPDYEGVRGTITRESGGKPPTVAQLAGDIDDEGLLSIDESMDGRAISGNWLGELQPGSCGKEFRGTWRNASDDSTHPFVLNKTGSWQ
ncbi:hypothetical protein [Variovorax sp. RA8]|uniref:hypothetical protein n=1 Tax=Variovorax sp. (strain JCM 16519 / RA8) TaxID=662548 RepID=UPI001316646B|nr:hypothetical protein [Variovorax sp. RA8]VTU36219.1 hypothetical protein RA8CHR_05420 [Variovorax sp. RA8]